MQSEVGFRFEVTSGRCMILLIILLALVDIGEQTVVPEVISKHDHASRYLIAGAVAGATSRRATAPLDRLKVILQVQTKRARIMPAIREIWGECGLLGFFRGNGLNVLKVAPESAIRFYTYEMLKSFIVHANGEEDKANVGTATRLVSGGLADTNPMDLCREIWVQEGPRAFYKGVVPCLLGMVLCAGIDLAAYETLKDMSKKYIVHDREPGALVQLGLQNARYTEYKGMSDVFRRTFQHERLRGFYKGIFPNLLKVVPSASITYMIYESMKKSLDLG
ncbi:hypothetical protein EV1_044282 [Malus domestica]